MEKFGRSQGVTRVEDVRFLTGHGRYGDDVAPEGSLYAVFFRSPVAHATITGLDVSAAREAPGVHLVYTLDDLEAAGVKLDMDATTAPNIDGSKGAAPFRPVLARGRVRYVGEPIAMVLADSIAEGMDAAELIEFDYDELPAKLDVGPGGEQLHDDVPDNLAYDFGAGDREATEKAFAEAARTVTLEVGDNRVIVNPMEPRACHAVFEDGKLTFSFGGQGVWGMKKTLAAAFGMEPENVRVLNPDVGGGFGMKQFYYNEYLPVALAARETGRPVRWTADRSESMMTDAGARDLVTLAEMAFDKNNRITAYRVTTRSNLGAYNSPFGQMIQSFLFARVVMGVYDVQNLWLNTKGYYTNTNPTDAYRGAGRPEAIYVLERIMDRAARELGIDTLELHRLNFIPPEKFPYETVSGENYDVGDFDRVLSSGLASADWQGFAARKSEDASRGLLRGIGLSYYIESILGDPSEGAKVEFHEDGTVSIYVGTQSNGQGHETVYARFLSDQTGIPADRIRVIQGDSDLIAQGGGTGGSRSVTTQTNATLATVDVMVKAFAPFLADKMGVDVGDITFDEDGFSAPGSNLRPTMMEAAEMARAEGREDLLVHEARSELPGRSYPNGCHIAEVTVDPDTGVTTVEKYTVVDDFGNLINPLLAEGQVHGGVAQGIGQAVSEHVVYSEDGQLLTATFMDYAMPRAGDMPSIGFSFEPVPSTRNPMGMKGCGEAGTVGALAAVSNAVQDALWDRGIRQVDMPFTPLRVWNWLRDVPQAAE